MIQRMLIFFFGLCMLSLGIATTTHAELGTGTLSSVALVLNRATGVSMGFFVFLTNFFFFVIQIIIDSRAILQKALRQLPICAAFGLIFDIAMMVTSFVAPETYVGQIGYVLLGTLGVGIGIASMVFARIAILPPEGVVLAVLGRWGGSFGTLRMGIDIFLVVVASTLSLILFGTVVGVREGTLIAALLGGQIAKRVLIAWGRLFPKHRVLD